MKHTFFKIYIVILLMFTIYIVLDTLVLSKSITKVDTNTTDYKSINNTITDTSYTDDNISININTYTKYNTKIYVADIAFTDIKYLKTAFANNTYGKNITAKVSDIASDNYAILAINGDYYGVQENGYVVRNGITYRTTSKNNQEDLVIYNDGTFDIINESSISLSTLDNVYQVLSFGPSLIINGKISVSKQEEVGKAMASNPRTAIGIIDSNHYIFIVSDGRTSESEGLSSYELASFATTLGVNMLYNLDGGGSSTMYFNGKVINKPTTSGRTIKERSVSDIVYIGY